MRKEFKLSELPETIKRRISNSSGGVGGRTDRRESIRTAAEYNKGFVSSPALGDLYMQGSVFFVLSHGSFPDVEKEKIPIAQKYIADKCKGLVVEGSTFYNKFLTIAENTFYVVPQFKFPQPRMLTFLKANVCFWFLSDYLDNDLSSKVDITEESRYARVTSLAEAIAGILAGNFETVAKLPTIEGLDELFELLLEVVNELKEQVEDYDSHSAHLVNSWRNFIYHILGFSDGMGNSWQCEHTVMFVRRHSGFYALVEIAAMLDGVALPADIRTNFLVQTLYGLGNDIACLSTDVLGIQTDLNSCMELPGNLALWKVMGERASLQESVDYVQQLQQEHCFDFVKIKKTLLKSYPESVELQKFVKTLEYFTDGAINLYLIGQRHGGASGYLKKRVDLVDQNIRAVKVVHLRD